MATGSIPRNASGRATGSACTANKDRGYTLIELLVVIAILGILTGIAVPNYYKHRQKAYRGAAVAAMKDAALAIETFATDQGRYDALDGSDENSSVLTEQGFNPTEWVELNVVADITSYCIEGRNVHLPDKLLVYRSGSGVVDILPGSDAGCEAV